MDHRQPTRATPHLEALARAVAAGELLAYLLLDAQGRLLEAGPGAGAVLGLDREPAPGGRAASLFPAPARERFLELLAQVTRSGRAAADVLVLSVPGQEDPRAAAVSLLPVPGAQASGPAVVLLARDVSAERRETEKLRRGALDVIRLNADLRRESTARHAALQALEELSGRLRSVLEAASRVAIVATDTLGVITVFNPGAANLLGFNPVDMVERETPLAFLDQGEVDRRGRELAANGPAGPTGLDAFMALASSGRKDLGEWTLVRRDGSRFAGEVALSAIQGPQGVEGYLLVAVDVSGRKAAEEATAEREARLRAVLDGAGDAVLAVDEAGLIESANRAAGGMFGQDPEALAGMPLSAVAPLALKENFCALSLRSSGRRGRRDAQQCGVRSREMTGRRLNGETFPMELTVSAVELPSRRLCICIARDITARVKAQEAQLHYTRRLAEQQASLERDLRAAAEIQKSLLPGRLTPDPRYEVGWLFKPSAAIGGDIFNLLTPGPDRLSAYMLDVSGHGAPSALVAAAAAQAILLNSRGGADGVEPAPDQVLKTLDAEFPLERFDRYFSLFFVSVDLAGRSLRYCNGGHPPPVLAGREGGVRFLEAGGTVVGLGGMLPFECARAPIAPGDRLLLYTDGLTEFEDASGRAFGLERVLAWLDKTRDRDVRASLDLLDREIKAFGGGGGPQDDLSVLLIRFHFTQGGGEAER